MKKLRNIVIGTFIFLILCWFFALRYFNTGSKEPDNTVWESYIGRDTSVGILPDAYANYFTYTLVRTNGNVGFRIKGTFPDARYFSFNVYSLGDHTTQGSLIDHEIRTDSGRPNPFLVDKDSAEVGNNFTVHILPSKHRDKNLPNLLPFKDNVRILTMVIRLYDYNIDDFGGVAFPTVEAFSLGEKDGELNVSPVNLPTPLNLRWIVRRRGLPGMIKRLSLLYETENTVPLDFGTSTSQQFTIPFHRIDSRGYIENNDNRYLLAAITKEEDEVYYVKFKSPSYTTGPENINQTDVRYWSFNLGNSDTYNFNAIKDEDAVTNEDGYIHILLASKDAELEKRCEVLGINFLAWNMPWKKGLILFRHMLARAEFEAQIENVLAIKKDMTNFTATEAQKFMGDYAPTGVRLSREDFLRQYPVLQTNDITQ